jgi:threonine/homoserine/homoserine lactone efflux protein
MLSSYWFSFFLTAVILNITPGPDMIYLVSQSISCGKKVGFASILGFGTGALIHSLLVALGISAILTTSMVAFQIIKIAGAGYLMYQGIKTLVQTNVTIQIPACREEKKSSYIHSYFNAALVDLTNPKVAIFFMALLPQFYRPNGVSKVLQFMSLGLIIVVTAFFIEGTIVILSDKIAYIFREKKTVSKVLDKVFGSVLILLGVRLLFQKR